MKLKKKIRFFIGLSLGRSLVSVVFWHLLQQNDALQTKQGCQLKKLKEQVWPLAVSKRPNPQNGKRLNFQRNFFYNS